MGKQQLAKIGLKNDSTEKADYEVLDPTKKGKDKKPLTAALAGGLGGAVAGGGIGAATEKLNKDVIKIHEERRS